VSLLKLWIRSDEETEACYDGWQVLRSAKKGNTTPSAMISCHQDRLRMSDVGSREIKRRRVLTLAWS
jgi:hypothetical protein